MSSASATRSGAIDRLLISDYARDRVARAFYEVLADGLDLGPCGLARRSDREWLRGAMAVPLQQATDQALHALVWEVAKALEHGPEGLLARLEAGRGWTDVDGGGSGL